MSANKLFGSDTNEEQFEDITPEEAMNTLVGEGKKYATPAELAKALLHSQKHIKTLESETAQLREAQQKAQSVEELLKELRGATQQPSPAPAPMDDQQPDASGQQQQGKSIEELLEEKLNQRDASARAKANQDYVAAELSKKLGGDAGRLYREAGARLGVDLDELSAKSPEAVLRLVAGTVTTQPQQQASTPVGRRPATSGQQNPMSKKAIETLYKEGKITQHEKIRMENDGYTALGRDAFFS